MTKRIRKILFLVCLVLFILLAPTIILYSQGYRFDFDSKKLTQTGGLFLKILPKQAEVYLDDKLKKKTDFFFGSVLVENLLPKEYKIEVKKEGFYLWEKTLAVKEKEVTETKNIVLFPEEPKFQILTTGVKNFWPSIDQRKMVLLEETNPPTGGGWTLKLYELDNGRFPAAGQGLKALVEKPSTSPKPANWNGPYVENRALIDPWGKEYIYRYPGTHGTDYDLYSLGRSGQDDDENISNWE